MNLFVLMFYCESVHINLPFLKSKPWGLSDPLTLRTQKHEISGKVCSSCHIPLDRFFGNSLADLTGEARVLRHPPTRIVVQGIFSGRTGGPASALLLAPQFQSGSARGLNCRSSPQLRSKAIFSGCPGGPRQRTAPRPSISVWQRGRAWAGLSVPSNSGPRTFFSGRLGDPASVLLRTVESGRNGDIEVRHSKQWFAYCTPPDETVNLETCQNSNRRRAAVWLRRFFV